MWEIIPGLNDLAQNVWHLQATAELKEVCKDPAIIPALCTILGSSQNPQVSTFVLHQLALTVETFVLLTNILDISRTITAVSLIDPGISFMAGLHRQQCRATAECITCTRNRKWNLDTKLRYTSQLPVLVIALPYATWWACFRVICRRNLYVQQYFPQLATARHCSVSATNN